MSEGEAGPGAETDCQSRQVKKVLCGALYVDREYGVSICTTDPHPGVETNHCGRPILERAEIERLRLLLSASSTAIDAAAIAACRAAHPADGEGKP
jgi:hypothetical protein